VDCICLLWCRPLIASLVGCTLYCTTMRDCALLHHHALLHNNAQLCLLPFWKCFVCETCCALKRQKIFGMTNLPSRNNQWFPTFFISRPHLNIWHSRSAPAINCNIKVLNNNRQDEKHIILHGSLHPLYLHSYAQLTAPILISRRTVLAVVQLVLKFVETCWW